MPNNPNEREKIFPYKHEQYHPEMFLKTIFCESACSHSQIPYLNVARQLDSTCN